MAHELRKVGLAVAQQHGTKVIYDGLVMGEYIADLVVENALLLELKAVKALDNVHEAQCINYLKASGLRLALLLNFARPRLQIQRVAYRL